MHGDEQRRWDNSMFRSWPNKSACGSRIRRVSLLLKRGISRVSWTRSTKSLQFPVWRWGTDYRTSRNFFHGEGRSWTRITHSMNERHRSWSRASSTEVFKLFFPRQISTTLCGTEHWNLHNFSRRQGLIDGLGSKSSNRPIGEGYSNVWNADVTRNHQSSGNHATDVGRARSVRSFSKNFPTKESTTFGK